MKKEVELNVTPNRFFAKGKDCYLDIFKNYSTNQLVFRSVWANGCHELSFDINETKKILKWVNEEIKL